VKLKQLSRKMNNSNKHNVSFFVDGSFLPIRNGTNYSILNLMNALFDTKAVEPSLVISYRGWDKPELYYSQKFGTVFLPSDDYYHDTGVLEYLHCLKNIKISHIYNAEEILNMGVRLQRLGVKVIYEVINIDHILCSQFSDDSQKIGEILSLQKNACMVADHLLCRSEVDKQHLIEMGIDEEKITVYKGAINTEAIKYVPRYKPRYKILFLGHMYYPPNEECLKVIVDKILPELLRLDERYTVTIVGNTPYSTIQKYKNVKGLIFKGGMDNLGDLLAGYDMGIAPIIQGSGTRLKILDYMASGLQVITTNLGVEGLDSNISRYLKIEDDMEKYALTIHKTMENLGGYKEASMNAREFVELKYDWKNNLEPFLGIYKKLLNNK